MCLSVKLLKKMVLFNTHIIQTLGVLLLLTGFIIGLTINSEAGFFQSVISFSRNIFVSFFYILGAALIIIGILGTIGEKKNYPFCFIIHNIFMWLFSIVFFLIGLVSLILAWDLRQSSHVNCVRQEWSLQIGQVAYGASKNFCTEDCICFIPNITLFPVNYLEQNEIKYYTESRQQDVNQFNQCPNYGQLPRDQTRDIHYSLLQAAEESFHCAGWCDPAPIYQFSDVGLGVPTGANCYKIVNDFIHRYGLGIGIASMIISLILVIVMTLACCLCLHPYQHHMSLPLLNNQ